VAFWINTSGTTKYQGTASETVRDRPGQLELLSLIIADGTTSGRRAARRAQT